MPAAAVLGARNLGGAIARHLAGRGWEVAAIARSQDSLGGLRETPVVPIRGDASRPEDLEEALGQAADRLGGLDLIVNAVSASRPPAGDRPFGGGPILSATIEDFRGWGGAVAEQAFVFLSTGARALDSTGGGTLVQITGGSARRAAPNRGSWAAGTAALRALAHAAAQELRADGIHVALLIADGTIRSPKTSQMARDLPLDALLDQDQIAHAVGYLAEQTPRALTHELTLTPGGDRWTP